MNSKENIWLARFKKADFVLSNAALIPPILQVLINKNFDSSFVFGFGAFASYWERQLNPGTIGSLVMGISRYRENKKKQFANMNEVAKAVEYGQRIITHGILWTTIALGVYELYLKTLTFR